VSPTRELAPITNHLYSLTFGVLRPAPYTLPPDDQSQQLLPNEIMTHIYSFATKGTRQRCMRTSQSHFELAVKHVYDMVELCTLIKKPGPGHQYVYTRNPLFWDRTEFDGRPGAVIRSDIYRRAVRYLCIEDLGPTGWPDFDRLLQQFPLLLQVKWNVGDNVYVIQKDKGGSWSNLALSLAGPDEFTVHNGPSYLASLTLALAIPLSSLDYCDPYACHVPLDDFISQLGEHCKQLRALRVEQEDIWGDPDISYIQELFPATLAKLKLPDTKPEHLETILTWDLPQLREVAFSLKEIYVVNLDWLKPKTSSIQRCPRLECVRFMNDFHHDPEDPHTPGIDPHDMALWLCRTLPTQSQLVVEGTTEAGDQTDWMREVEERYRERRQLEREESRTAAR
jgi:hypothetical protein